MQRDRREKAAGRRRVQLEAAHSDVTAERRAQRSVPLAAQPLAVSSVAAAAALLPVVRPVQPPRPAPECLDSASRCTGIGTARASPAAWGTREGRNSRPA